MRRQLWWLAPLTAIWLVGMWMTTLYFRAGEPLWAIVVILMGNLITFGLSALIGVRRPDVRIGQLFALATAGFAISPFLLDEVVELIPEGMVRPLAVIGAALGPIALASVCWVIALFPDGRHPSKRWRWLSWYLVVFVVVFTPLSVFEFATADLAVDDFPEPLSDAAFLSALLPLLIGLVSLAFRYRQGNREVRAQLGWLFYGVTLYALFLIVGSSLIAEENVTAAAWDQIFYVGIPIGIAIAVFRYRLYDIGRIVSRSVSYALVVGAMLAVYAGAVTLIHQVLPIQEDLEVALATLVAVAVSVPLLRRVRGWVDRRFFRSRYDAAEVVSRLATDLQTTVDLPTVERRASQVIDEVLSPESVGIWLADEPA